MGRCHRQAGGIPEGIVGIVGVVRLAVRRDALTEKMCAFEADLIDQYRRRTESDHHKQSLESRSIRALHRRSAVCSTHHSVRKRKSGPTQQIAACT